jgi:hypothetical protein
MVGPSASVTWARRLRCRRCAARLLQIENDIRRLGFSADDIESNDFAYSADEKKLSKAYYVPLASWTSSTDKKE